MEEAKIIREIESIRNEILRNKARADEEECPFCHQKKEIKGNDFSDVILKNEQTGKKTFLNCGCREYQNEYKRKLELGKKLVSMETRLQYHREYLTERLREFRCTDGIKKKYQDKTFKNFKQEKNPEAYRKVTDYLKNFNPDEGIGLLLMGTVGTGKTHLAVATIRNLEMKGERCLFVNWSDLAEAERTRYDTGRRSREKELIEVPFLVIDDLGKDKMTEWSLSLLYRIVNGRYENCRPMIITTNTPPGEMKIYGEATVSRLREMMIQVMMAGEDIRKELKKERESDNA